MPPLPPPELPAPPHTVRDHRTHHGGCSSSLVMAIAASPDGPSARPVAALAAERWPCESPRPSTSEVSLLPPTPSQSPSPGRGGVSELLACLQLFAAAEEQ